MYPQSKQIEYYTRTLSPKIEHCVSATHNATATPASASTSALEKEVRTFITMSTPVVYATKGRLVTGEVVWQSQRGRMCASVRFEVADFSCYYK